MLNIFISIFLLFILLALFTFLFYLIYINLLPGSFYYPSTDNVTKQMLNELEISNKDTLIDLGSGDGKIIFAAAKRGAKAIGYELDPLLVKKSRHKIKELKIEKLASIRQKNFWKANWDEATIIVIYQFPKYVKELESVLENEIKKPTIVVSNAYPFPNKKPYLIKEIVSNNHPYPQKDTKKLRTDKLFFYRFGAKI